MAALPAEPGVALRRQLLLELRRDLRLLSTYHVHLPMCLAFGAQRGAEAPPCSSRLWNVLSWGWYPDRSNSS